MTDNSVVEQIKHYQKDIIKCPENSKRMIRCIERLMVLPVTISHLQETGVGRSVNELRKCGGEVGAAANALVCKWKSMVQAEEDSDAESEVEEDVPKETVRVSSPDVRNSPSVKNDSVDKHKKPQISEENKKQKTDHSSKKRQSSHSESRSSEKTLAEKHDHKSHRNKLSRSEHGSESDSKHSSSHRSKSDHGSRSNNSRRSESQYNGDSKTERRTSKSINSDNKSSKSTSIESKNDDIKQNNYKEKRRKEDSGSRSEKENRRKDERSHSSSSSKKYDARRIESESSDDDSVYKPRNKKRKKSDSEEDRKSETESRGRSESEEDIKPSDKFSGRSKHREFIKRESSEKSDAENDSEEEEKSPSSVHSFPQNISDNDEDMSNRSSPNNKGLSDNEVESEGRKSSSRCEDNEESNSDKDSDSDEKLYSPEREIYVPTKIKREKESPPRHSKSLSPQRHSKSSSDKYKSSHSKSSHSLSHKSSSHSSSHKSDSRSTNGKISSNKKEGNEHVKIKKEKEESDNLKKRKEEKSSESKTHRSSNSHSDPNEGSSSNKAEKKAKIKVEKQDDGSIDCVSGASFADALMGLSELKKKQSLKRKSTPSSPEKRSRPTEKSSDGKSKISIKSETRTSTSSLSSSSSKTSFKEPDLLSKNIKLEPLDVDLKSTLPEISPHYKPLPHYSPPDSPAGKRNKQLTQEEALSTIMSNKNQRTKVFSGSKSGYLKVPSLFDLCIQVLRDNIEALEYTGGVPYDLLKPVLDRATASQLFQLEHYNPYLVEDTDGLWKFHCNKDFRGKEPDEFETWRELYVRLLDERERKLEALKANITQSMAKSTPVRQTKLAYVDSVVKPPRNIAKKQMKFGTGKAVKHELVSKAMVGAASSNPAPAAVPVPAPPASARSSHSNAFPIPNFLKKKKAPLMQKTLQLMKGNRFKR
ncbi:transcription elongation factor B polypeptide 3-like [Macrosteles quadrilineatus]|uniref:transcription elongation factor B polypeptide 3-like n=1 Tax=Macrosteles quadrilineatus TaxID=74068 RepID=UPI0023E1826C|nr:transcription elongation factor B polypeptide 3-like [Macrosteles quadrilineatus]